MPISGDSKGPYINNAWLSVSGILLDKQQIRSNRILHRAAGHLVSKWYRDEVLYRIVLHENEADENHPGLPNSNA